jgi:hypothetical protein
MSSSTIKTRKPFNSVPPFSFGVVRLILLAPVRAFFADCRIRKSQRKARAFVFAFAVCADRSAVQLR